MKNLLDEQIKKLGGGEIIKIESGETIFKVASDRHNPVVKPQDIGLTWLENKSFQIGSVFNPGAECVSNRIILLPRCHRNYHRSKYFDEKLKIERYRLKNYRAEIWPLVSEDSIHFRRLENMVIKGDGTDHKDFVYGIEDIRIIKQDQIYWLIGCGKLKPPFTGGNADRIAIYSTQDFRRVTYHGMVESFDSRNAVLFPELVDGKLYMLFRFHPDIHLDSLEAGPDQLLNPTKYRDLWQRIYARRSQNLLLPAGQYSHEREKIGPGPQLIKTSKGWLFIYHGVGEINRNICKAYGLAKEIKRGYSISAALLDFANPRKVLCRTRNPIYIPSAPYELDGNDEYPVDVPAVVFPVGALVRQDKILIYCGSGDKYVLLLSCRVDDLINYLERYCKVS